MKRILHLLSRLTKSVLIVVFTLFIIANLFILLSGRFYLYKGIFNTYLQGKTGPDIYDLEVFPYSTIKAGLGKQLLKSKKINHYSLSPAELNNLKSTGTTAFLVLKDDSLLHEQYLEEHKTTTVSNAFSAAKTVVSLLVGIALQEGKIASLDDAVGKYLPEYQSEERSQLTVRHLLYMASGLSWSESGKNPLSDNAESYYGEDLYGMLMAQKQKSKPGKTFVYQSGNSQLLGFIVERATGKNLSNYCAEKLWKPLGADMDAYWSLDKSQGDEKAFCCLYASARDYVKLGALILHRGMYNGQQIVSQKYIDEMILPAPVGTEEGVENTRYGMHIWLTEFKGKKVVYCRGILGQYIVSMPEENLVFVRLGHHRKPNFSYEDYKAGKISLKQIDHPEDLYEYLEIVQKITN